MFYKNKTTSPDGLAADTTQYSMNKDSMKKKEHSLAHFMSWYESSYYGR